jgi:type IV pilus assembly protein PilZ
VQELRRHNRAPLDTPVEFVKKGSSERISGRAKDISLGGMFIETATPLPFSSELVVHITLPSPAGSAGAASKAALSLPGVVRWTRDGGMGVQFGLVGARETHTITELTRVP